jgi:hypothetical protein
MPSAAYRRELEKVRGLREVALRCMPDVEPQYELPVVMELILDGLHQNSKIAKDEVDHHTSYKDMVGSIFPANARINEED